MLKICVVSPLADGDRATTQNAVNVTQYSPTWGHIALTTSTVTDIFIRTTFPC